LITSIAGFTGLLSASGILYLVNSIGIDSDFFKQPQVDLKVALSATFIIIIAGAIAGLVPAIKAAKIHPIEALRSY
jgi:putative ABC transport system permease protein